MDNLIVDTILLALVFWAGYTWGKHTAIIRILHSVVNNPEQLGQALDRLRAQQAQESDSTEDNQLIVERHGDVIYIYDQQEFLAQGATLEEALDRVAQRFPDRHYSGKLSEEQAEELGIKL